MAIPDIKKHLPAFAVLALPLIVVKVAAGLLGRPAPQSADAAPAVAAATPAQAVAKPAPWTEKQTVASKRIESLRKETFGPPPFLFIKAEPPPPDTNTHPTPDVVIPTNGITIPKFVLGAVMAGSSGQRALINGKSYREGDTIRDSSWKVTAIECSKRSVTLTETKTERTITISVDMPQ